MINLSPMDRKEHVPLSEADAEAEANLIEGLCLTEDERSFFAALDGEALSPEERISGCGP
ncbi:MAG: hypothetical protein R3F55_13190 [Alphaproteobacteria bacterium]